MNLKDVSPELKKISVEEAKRLGFEMSVTDVVRFLIKYYWDQKPKTTPKEK